MLFESVFFNLLPIIVGILVVAMVFESCWRKCPPDKLIQTDDRIWIRADAQRLR